MDKEQYKKLNELRNIKNRTESQEKEFSNLVKMECTLCRADYKRLDKEIELVDQPTDKDLEDEEELSDCCGAEIVAGTFCKKCKEHAK